MATFVDQWPERPFQVSDFWSHAKPCQLDDGRWWVRGRLAHGGGLAVDAIFEDLEQPAVELAARDLTFMQAEAAQYLKTIRAALEQLQANPELTDRERVLLCRDLLLQYNTFSQYAERAAALDLHTALLNYLHVYYRAEEDE
jgi:plasmid stabilization system protein ParE